MEKIKLGIIFGGMSTENEVSVKSATSIMNHINTNKYEVFKIYITKNGEWIDYNKNKKIENVMEYLKYLDVAFPVLHGLYGEDGTIQGLFELLELPYVGCKVLASSIGMDKVYTKIIFERAGLSQAKYEYIRKYKDKYFYINKSFDEEYMSLNEIIEKIAENLKFPTYVKPSNSGSSIGINKAKNIEELRKCIEYASAYDNKIVVEEGILGKEVECAVLGNEEIIVSGVGEIKPADEYYSYEAKYNNKNSITEIPAKIEYKLVEEIRAQAKKAFKAIDGKGLSRVDFFIEKDSNKIYINEINTLPGFTNISMYPKLFEEYGISYEKLIDKLIELAIKI